MLERLRGGWTDCRNVWENRVRFRTVYFFEEESWRFWLGVARAGS